MAQLEEIVVGCQVKGISAKENVTVIAVQWYGSAVLEVTYKNEKGQLNSQLLMRKTSPSLRSSATICPGALMQMPTKCGWFQRHIVSIWRTCLTRILLCIRLQSNHCRTRSRLYIRKCYPNCRCDMYWQTTQGQVKQL